MLLSRRHFLRRAAAVSVGFGGLQAFVSACDRGVERAESDPGRSASVPSHPGFGPPAPDPAGIFDLPEGFTYRVISRFRDTMDDGFLVPSLPDGMAAFPGPDGTTILVCNHEVTPRGSRGRSALGDDYTLLDRLDPADCYDYGVDARPAGGGTTTIVYDTRAGEVVRRFLSLAGTLRNCAGGPTPWNSWLTCEEIVMPAEVPWARSHGWVFEVPATADPGLARPVPIEAMGRFNHEAVAVEPKSGVVYQTEDRHDGLLYRYVPDAPGDLHAGGRLQALAVPDRPSLDTRNWGDGPELPVGTSLPVRWIDLRDVHAPDDDLRMRGFEAGAARFARGEGMWYGNGAVYFACTNGGAERLGQIWKYTPSHAEATADEADAPGRLELFLESDDVTVLENADNITVAPWGDLFVCEDGDGDQYLIGVRPDGATYRFGRNAVSESELAGACFSPDGSTLFMNIQEDGLTLAITGDWAQPAARRSI
ncbi:MAG: alkaline phosphatase PhoX [Gemmatimonadota bacterium]